VSPTHDEVDGILAGLQASDVTRSYINTSSGTVFTKR